MGLFRDEGLGFRDAGRRAYEWAVVFRASCPVVGICSSLSCCCLQCFRGKKHGEHHGHDVDDAGGVSPSLMTNTTILRFLMLVG